MSAVKDTAGKAKDTAGDAAGGAGDAAKEAMGGIGDQLRSAMSDVVSNVVMPAVRDATQKAATSAIDMAKEKGPDFAKEQAMKAVGADDPSELGKKAMGKAGEMVSGSGGITGMAGKLMSKLGGKGGKKGVATGYGQGRRIMVQQHQYVPVKTEDVYRAWTTSEWPEYMHRVNTLDRQVEDDSVRYSVGVKGFWFKKNFTAQIQEAQPFKFIVWSTTQGNIKNTGRVSFHAEGDDMTLMVLNLDMAPSGLREKWVRGFRYHKRGIRSDFHRFSAWAQMRTQEQLDDMEGWLGTIEGGKVTQSHEDYLEEHPEEQERGKEGDEDTDPYADPYLQDQEGEGEESEGDDEDQDEENGDQDEAQGEEGPEDEAAGDQADGETDDGQDEEEGDDEEPEDEEDDEGEDEEEPEDEDEPEAEEEGDDYDDMSLADLRTEARERDLSPRGSRAVLIDRLREDDEDERDGDDEDEDEDEKEKPQPKRKPQSRQRQSRQRQRTPARRR